MDSNVLKSLLEPIRVKFDLPALAGAVVTSEGLRCQATCGVRKAGTKVEATDDDLWHLGSDTKAMTATLVAMLVEEGKLTWDQELGGLFQNVRELRSSDLAKATVSDLLHHTAGLPANLAWAEIDQKGGSVRQQRLAALKMAAAKPLQSKPGAAYLYSNAGYVLAGCAIEEVTNREWEKVMEDRLFKPLGMKHAGFGGLGTAGKIDQPWPHGSGGQPLPMNGPAVDNPPVMGPAGRVHATLADWARFVVDHLKGGRGQEALLKASSYERLHSPGLGDYAMGWLAVRRPWAGGMALSHSGDNTMNHCVVWLAPAKDFAVLVCTNRGSQEKAADAAVGAMIQQWQNG
jgi:CubicO group peptidase (beta-lactamase class C family)